MTDPKNQKPGIVEGSKPFKVITIRWPRDLKMPTPRGQWQRLEDGKIQASYTRDELRVCLEIFEAIK